MFICDHFGNSIISIKDSGPMLTVKVIIFLFISSATLWHYNAHVMWKGWKLLPFDYLNLHLFAVRAIIIDCQLFRWILCQISPSFIEKQFLGVGGLVFFSGFFSTTNLDSLSNSEISLIGISSVVGLYDLCNKVAIVSFLKESYFTILSY